MSEQGGPKATRAASGPGVGVVAGCVAGAVLLPAVCIGLAFGLLEAEPELDIWRIWAPDKGGYAEDKRYLEDLESVPGTEITPSGYDTCVFNSYPRDGGTHLTQASLTELMARMPAMERVTVEHKGNTFSYYDACSGGADVADMYLGYTLPCPKLTVAHAYSEGGWEMEYMPLANSIWYTEVVPLRSRPLIANFLLSTDFPPALDSTTAAALLGPFGLPNTTKCIPAAYCSAVVQAVSSQAQASAAAAGADAAAQAAAGAAAAAQTGATCCLFECATTCAAATAAAMAPSLNPSAYMTFPDCVQCMTHAERTLFAALENPAVAGAFGYTGDYGGTNFSVIHDTFVDVGSTHYKDQWLYETALAGVQANFAGQYAAAGQMYAGQAAAAAAAGNAPLAAGLTAAAQQASGTAAWLAAKTPMEFAAWALEDLFGIKEGVTNTFTAEAPGMGLDKGFKKINGSTEENLHEWASGGITGWNPTSVYPNEMMFGRTSADANGTLTNVQGLQVVYFLNEAKYLKSKVASPIRQQGPGNYPPVEISEDDALEVVMKMKEKMEEVWTRNWDKDDDETADVNRYTAYTGGDGGTFYRVLKKTTEDSVVPSVVSYVVIIVVSVVLMMSPRPTESKMLVSLLGALLSIVAFSGALGLVVLGGSRLMFTSVWTLPFLMVGLGVDDMYLILTTLVQEGGTTVCGFIRTMKKCLVPVTLTSFTNAGMFAMLMFVPVPAVREMGKIAVLGIGLQYLVMVTAFPCICYLDMLRTESKRLDCLWCCKGTRGTPLKNHLYTMIYKPILGNLFQRITIIFLAVVALGVGVGGATKSEAGASLKDFFQPDTVEMAYMETQDKYFDISWPLRVNFGELDYVDPEVQLHMLQIYEGVMSTPYATEIASESLWSASLALWGTVDCLDVGMGEKCGKDFGCESTWVLNSRSLKLNTASPPGVCRLGSDIAVMPGETSTYSSTEEYCPVFSGWSETQLASCIGIWRTRGRMVSTYNPGAPLNLSAERDETPAVPIKRTYANGGGLLYNIGISGNAGYVDAIEATRKLCDEDDSNGMHCWLAGVTYDFWEQYLTLYETAGLVVGLAAAAGFFISFHFLLISFVMDNTLQATIVGKTVAALFGSCIILLICGMSIVTVFGITSLAGSTFTVLVLTSTLTAIGFSVEFAVHIVHRWLTAPQHLTKADRVNYAMELLSLPMGCGCAASVAGLLCMLATENHLVRESFFLPLILVQVVTFFFGTWFLPSVLYFVPDSCLRVGPNATPVTKVDPALGTVIANVDGKVEPANVDGVEGNGAADGERWAETR